MKNLDFVISLVVVVVFCTLPFCFLGFLNVANNKDVAFGVFLMVVGVALLLAVLVIELVIEHKYNK